MAVKMTIYGLTHLLFGVKEEHEGVQAERERERSVYGSSTSSNLSDQFGRFQQGKLTSHRAFD